MTKLSNILMILAGELAHWCPACNMLHLININKRNSNGSIWTWNKDVNKPTFSPSVNVNGKYRCHYFIRSGMIEYCIDSTHSLAGKTINIPVINENEK